MEVFENASFRPEPGDLDYLRRQLGARLEVRQDGWAITRLVGHLTLPSGTTLRIRSPKAKAASVLSLMAYADPSLKELRLLGLLADGASDDDVGALAARLFVRELLRVIRRQGMQRSYRRVRVKTATVRGSIDFARLCQMGGELSRMPCVVWERLPHTKLNQLFASAIQRISRDTNTRSVCRQGLQQLAALFSTVPGVIDRDLVNGRAQLARHEQPFATALALARIVLLGANLVDGEQAPGPAYLINLESLFERAVVQAVRRSGVAVLTKAPVPYVSKAYGPDGIEARPRAMQMDLYCPSTPRGPLVIDAKYKSKVSSGNLQQMVTYCYVTGARQAVLVLPVGSPQPRISYHFRSTDAEQRAVTVDVAYFPTNGRSVAAWEQNGECLVESVLGSSESIAVA